uniref:Translation initiation factor IF-3 n=1 Tax=Bangiopsis subsimplex TaxID=139980 RepID=A0A1C9CCK6_9RHOD|nr:translation initiation factor 3 [Bangiopsis subsimplex]AOM66116.1 translation initiation factor 3 [Bangiopsis subsimplex]ARO90326.1 translation initiation factor 3 [Bangiopsis subsimplex]
MNNQNKKVFRDIPQINDRIQYPLVRLIDAQGEQLGVFPISEAKNLAQEQQLDLVLISDRSDPPVCKIINYGKYKFTQEKKAKEARKKQQSTTIKEVKMRYNIESHDYNVRLNQANRFLQAGDKVKTTIIFRGREIQHSDLALGLLKKMAEQLSEISEIQQQALKEGKSVTMILSPKKQSTA